MDGKPGLTFCWYYLILELPLYPLQGGLLVWHRGEITLLVLLVENLEGLGPSVLPVVSFYFCYLQLQPILGGHLALSGVLTLP